MAPVPGGTASCIACPRARTRRTASSSESASAATSAEYSPSEWPAANAGKGKSGMRSRMAASRAQLIATMAGCAFAVSVRRSSGPSRISLDSGSPSAASARSNASRAALDVVSTSLPIPTDCDPCPGKSHATLMLSRTRLAQMRPGVTGAPSHPSHSDDRAAPRDARSKRAHEDRFARPDLAGAHALIEQDGNRRARRVADAIDVHEHLFGRHLESIDDLIDDALIRLVGANPVDVRRGYPGAFERVLARGAEVSHGRLEDVLTPHLHEM